MEWISVKDKLPNDFPDKCEHDWVLVYGKTKNRYPLWCISLAQFDNGQWKLIEDNIGIHDCDASNYEFYPEEITYWSFINLPEYE